MAKPSMTVRLDGAEELQRKLERMPEAVAKESLEKAARAGAEPIRDVASQLAPRSTVGFGPGGTHLADNIVVETKALDRFTVAVGVGPGEGYWYGIFPELGTPYSAAQPYLRPAFDAMESLALKRARVELALRLARTLKVGI